LCQENGAPSETKRISYTSHKNIFKVPSPMMVGDCSWVRQTSDAAIIAGANEVSKKRNMVLKNIVMI